MGKKSGSSSGFINKNEVLDVKPLRSIAPIFPNQSGIPSSQGAPSTGVSPTYSFPPGVAPCYPFFVPNESGGPTPNQAGPSNYDNSIPSPVPLNSFRTSPLQYSAGDSGPSRRINRSHKGGAARDDGCSNYHSQSDQFAEGTSKKRRERAPKKTTAVERSAPVEIDDIVAKSLRECKLIGLEPAQQDDGNKELVDRILMLYNLLRKRIIQFDESRGDNPSFTKRPDMTAGTILMTKGIRTNNRKIIGAVPGIEVGDIFFFRMEMCLAGLHAPVMAGIDYMGVNASEHLALSIVSSGGYEDKGEDGDVLIYSGHGGVDRRDGQLFDQKLERGNLALETSLHRANEVRVIRGLKDVVNGSGKVYVYDGLYKIHESWTEKGKSGCNVFMYKLVRIPRQPKAFTQWKSIQRWKDGVTTRTGMILPDLTSGEEILPIFLVNDVDNERGPAHFTYTRFLRYDKKPFDLPRPFSSCTCTGGCHPGDTNCPCIQINEGFVPYVSPGVLVSHKTMIHECGSSCLCPLTCRNRVSQAGLKVRLEVFKTNNRGWGLRSWDPIRSGQFICVYGGEVIDTSQAMELDSKEDGYMFDSTRAYPSLECVPDGNAKVPFSLIINAYSWGNVARFMNHSCSPNVFWQTVLRENNNEAYLDIAFYAFGHIPPLQELTFDYGVVQNNTRRKKKCLCGSSKCRGFFY